MDLFEEWLNKEDSEWISRALTDSSYINYQVKGVKKSDPRYEELHSKCLNNKDLALLGDAIIKFEYSNYLLDKVEKLTEEKAKLESDKYLVEKVASHYNIIPKIKKDYDDKKLPNDYNYKDSPGKKCNRHKYIATAVEAVIGAIYRETDDQPAIKKLVISWIDFADKD